MKKFLLSLAVLALGATAMNAEEYTIFSADNYESLEWTGDANGFTTNVTVDGKTFTITTAKAKSTNNLIQPGDQIRVYKNSDITITSDDFEFTKVALTSTGGNYGGEQTVSEGWAQSYEDVVLTLTTETPANTVTMSATNNQYRVINIVVSDEETAPATNPYVYLVGNQADWAEPSAANQAVYDNWRLFDNDGDGIYTATYTIPEGDMYFRVYPELTGWGSTPYASSSVSSDNVNIALDTPLAYATGEGCWVLASNGGAYTFSLDTNAGTMEVYVEGASAAHPHLIATVEDLCNAYKLTKAGEMVYFAQTEDIDMAGVTDYICFVGGDNVTYSPQITYDGQNHLIKNFAPANGDAGDGLHCYCTSIFGVLNGTVKNLGIINVNIDSAQGCGVIAGYAGHSTGTSANVENVFVTGKVKGTSYLGGIFGTSNNDVNITNCFVNIELEGGANSAAIVGRLRNALSLNNVYAAGTVSATSGALVVNTDKSDIAVDAKNVVAFNSGVADAVNSGIALTGDIELATADTEAALIAKVQAWEGFSATKMVYGLPGLDAFAYEVFRLPSVKSVKETIALESGADVTVDYELTVGFVNANNVFACDAAGDFIQLYGKNSLKVGDVIPGGWSATYDLYSGNTPELKNFGTLPEVTEGTFVAKEVAAADITTDLVNSVVLVKDVVFAEATPSSKSNFTGKVDDVELSFRNNYTLEGVEAGTYDVTIVVIIYNNAPSLYVINYKPSETSGIEAIEAETAAPVYYNLQGVEVANPENGVFIVRRGNKVSKEIIR